MKFINFLLTMLALCVVSVVILLGCLLVTMLIVELTGLWSVVVFCALIFTFCAAGVHLENGDKYT